MEKTRIIYDTGEDILSLAKSKKVKSSVDVGDFIIDIGYDGLVSGVEILNASENIKVSQQQLRSLEKASLSVNYKPGCVYIHLNLQFNKKEKEITIPLTIDLNSRKIKNEKTEFVFV